MTTRSRTSHNWTRLNELRSTIAYSSRFVEANLLKQFLVPERSMLSWDKSTVKGNASIRNHNITFQNTPLKAYILRNPQVCIASVALCDQMFCSDPSPRWLLFCWIMCFKGANQSSAFWVPPCSVMTVPRRGDPVTHFIRSWRYWWKLDSKTTLWKGIAIYPRVEGILGMQGVFPTYWPYHFTILPVGVYTQPRRHLLRVERKHFPIWKRNRLYSQVIWGIALLFIFFAFAEALFH